MAKLNEANISISIDGLTTGNPKAVSNLMSTINTDFDSVTPVEVETNPETDDEEFDIDKFIDSVSDEEVGDDEEMPSDDFEEPTEDSAEGLDVDELDSTQEKEEFEDEGGVEDEFEPEVEDDEELLLEDDPDNEEIDESIEKTISELIEDGVADSENLDESINYICGLIGQDVNEVNKEKIYTHFNKLDEGCCGGKKKKKAVKESQDEDEFEETAKCNWCGEEFSLLELRNEKDLGYLCNHCIRGIESRGEELEFIENLDEGNYYMKHAPSCPEQHYDMIYSTYGKDNLNTIKAKNILNMYEKSKISFKQANDLLKPISDGSKKRYARNFKKGITGMDIDDKVFLSKHPRLNESVENNWEELFNQLVNKQIEDYINSLKQLDGQKLAEYKKWAEENGIPYEDLHFELLTESVNPDMQFGHKPNKLLKGNEKPSNKLRKIKTIKSNGKESQRIAPKQDEVIAIVESAKATIRVADEKYYPAIQRRFANKLMEAGVSVNRIGKIFEKLFEG